MARVKLFKRKVNLRVLLIKRLSNCFVYFLLQLVSTGITIRKMKYPLPFGIKTHIDTPGDNPNAVNKYHILYINGNITPSPVRILVRAENFKKFILWLFVI